MTDNPYCRDGCCVWVIKHKHLPECLRFRRWQAETGKRAKSAGAAPGTTRSGGA